MSVITEEVDKLGKVVSELTCLLDETIKENEELKEDIMALKTRLSKYESIDDDWW